MKKRNRYRMKPKEEKRKIKREGLRKGGKIEKKEKRETIKEGEEEEGKGR